jgi:hypothetical protein
MNVNHCAIESERPGDLTGAWVPCHEQEATRFAVYDEGCNFLNAYPTRTEAEASNDNIIETSPNGRLRLRALSKTRAVVELYAHGVWVWCAWRSSPMERARATFNNQVKYHLI